MVPTGGDVDGVALARAPHLREVEDLALLIFRELVDVMFQHLRRRHRELRLRLAAPHASDPRRRQSRRDRCLAAVVRGDVIGEIKVKRKTTEKGSTHIMYPQRIGRKTTIAEGADDGSQNVTTPSSPIRDRHIRPSARKLDRRPATRQS